MSETLYVVTSGCYSDYHIEAIFKDKEKAEFYCTCHEDCDIKDWTLDDDRVFTVFDMVTISFTIRKDREDNVSFRFRHLTEEDASYLAENREGVSVYGDWMTIVLHRRLPSNYNEQKIKDKYTKVYQDLRAEILYMMSEVDSNSSYEQRNIVSENIAECIRAKFGIENVEE